MTASRRVRGGRILRGLPLLALSVTRLAWGASRARVLLLLGIQITEAVAVFATVLAINSVLNAVVLLGRGDASTTDVLPPVVLLAILGTLTAALSAVATLQQRLLRELVERAVWRDIFEVSTALELKTFDDPTFYDQAARIEENAAWRTQVVVQSLVMVVGNSLGVVAAAAGLLGLAPLLAIPLLLSGVPLLLTSRLTARHEFEFQVRQGTSFRERHYLQQVLTRRDEAKEVRAYSLARRLHARWEANYNDYLSIMHRHIDRLTRFSVIGNLASAILTAGTLLLAVYLVARGDLAASAAGAALVAVRILGSRVAGVNNGLGDILEASLFLRDLETFRERVPEVHHSSAPTATAAPDRFDEIVAESVSFTYPDASQPSVVDVSMRIRRGEVIALVGENGSGKTTLAKLLANLFNPDEGGIYWDGENIQQYDPESVRRSIAVLFQDFSHFRLTAHDNIALGSEDEGVPEATVRDAARRADADSLLRSLPDGYQTVLSKEFLRGTELSLGEWQRVALARAFVRDAPLLILDEPSASLDPRAEHDLFERLRSLFKDRTVVVISHRFSTVRTADRIFVLSRGRVIEAGTHAELMRGGGVYADLFQLQANAYAAKSTDTRSNESSAERE